MDKDASEIRQEIEATRAELGDTVEAIAYQTDVKARIKDAVDDRISGAKDKVVNAATTVKHRVAKAAGITKSSVQKQGQEMADSMESRVDMVLENPLGLVGGAFALGLIAGMFVPITDVERERVGPVKDRLVERAQQSANDAIERGKQSMTDTVQAVMQSASGPG